ncbi:uncharacterized protein MYCFIDRAFT_84541 [Pseudocercospora fijiensis CIRAD86]|uniref:Uncharacterized protein n=1 Tax=Pseudocercospora fijiensis (strain CIRAD86) TaxID=383855 RepID=M3BAR0_PSEFD|nr:uncharacterized protein MYCFIDRAFT_84541 [Pseudocercospora fijiensis CIRAD86]EME86402.1 hypothetical protein MYCFIDRAFT_84541 [Pseudocercospora fijiensis CIRAD86]
MLHNAFRGGLPADAALRCSALLRPRHVCCTALAHADHPPLPYRRRPSIPASRSRPCYPVRNGDDRRPMQPRLELHIASLGSMSLSYTCHTQAPVIRTLMRTLAPGGSFCDALDMRTCHLPPAAVARSGKLTFAKLKELDKRLVNLWHPSSCGNGARERHPNSRRA